MNNEQWLVSYVNYVKILVMVMLFRLDTYQFKRLETGNYLTYSLHSEICNKYYIG